MTSRKEQAHGVLRVPPHSSYVIKLANSTPSAVST